MYNIIPAAYPWPASSVLPQDWKISCPLSAVPTATWQGGDGKMGKKSILIMQHHFRRVTGNDITVLIGFSRIHPKLYGRTRMTQ